MKLQIYEPGSGLADFVKYYWTLESDKENTPVRNTIVPDGTMKLIFHYGDTYKHYPGNGESVMLPKCFLIGQLTRPYVVEPLGITGSFVVRFHPHGFLPFTTIPIKEMENTAIPVERIFGKAGKEIENKILAANSTAIRIDLIEAFLLKRLISKKNIDKIVKSAIDTILGTNGQFSVNEHSNQSEISRRHLTRKFTTAIGLSPKQLAKTVRIQATLKKLLTNEVSSLTGLAHDNNFFDQAHFIKDFKEFTGLTPKEFYGDDLKMSLIIENI